MGIYTGGTLHEVANVVGAGNAMDPTGSLHIADNATITKMIRVIMLAPVLIIMSILLSRKDKTLAPGNKSRKTKITIPWFAIGFLVVIALNSLLDMIVSTDILSVSRSMISSGFPVFAERMRLRRSLVWRMWSAWILISDACPCMPPSG